MDERTTVPSTAVRRPPNVWTCPDCGKRNPVTVDRCAICRAVAPAPAEPDGGTNAPVGAEQRKRQSQKIVAVLAIAAIVGVVVMASIDQHRTSLSPARPAEDATPLRLDVPIFHALVAPAEIGASWLQGPVRIDGDLNPGYDGSKSMPFADCESVDFDNPAFEVRTSARSQLAGPNDRSLIATAAAILSDDDHARWAVASLSIDTTTCLAALLTDPGGAAPALTSVVLPGLGDETNEVVATKACMCNHPTVLDMLVMRAGRVVVVSGVLETLGETDDVAAHIRQHFSEVAQAPPSD